MEEKAQNSSHRALSSPSHAIVVCCHAIYVKPPKTLSDQIPSQDEKNWLIESFQRGETSTYIDHIETGVSLLIQDPSSILVFSGGATKRHLTSTAEAQSYLDVAIEHDLFGQDTTPSSLRQRMFVEERATDSFQNILLSLIQFPLFVQQLREDSGTKVEPLYPDKLTIISHEFKRARFMELHIPAIHFPLSRTAFIGIDPPFSPDRLAGIAEGDRLRGYGAWEKDLYAAGPVLSRKRTTRGWDGSNFEREVLSRLNDRSIEGLCEWKGGESGIEIWDGRAPWES
jgi:hypothetical protein